MNKISFPDPLCISIGWNEIPLNTECVCKQEKQHNLLNTESGAFKCLETGKRQNPLVGPKPSLTDAGLRQTLECVCKQEKQQNLLNTESGALKCLETGNRQNPLVDPKTSLTDAGLRPTF